MKWDWLLYRDVTLTEKLTTSLVQASNHSGRSMVLSLSNNAGHNRELMKKVKELGSSISFLTSVQIKNIRFGTLVKKDIE